MLASVSDEEAVESVSAITLVTGLLFLLPVIFKMGWISLLLSKAVITDLVNTYGAELRLARVKSQVLSLLSRDGVLDESGLGPCLGQIVRSSSRQDRRPILAVATNLAGSRPRYSDTQRILRR